MKLRYLWVGHLGEKVKKRGGVGGEWGEWGGEKREEWGNAMGKYRQQILKELPEKENSFIQSQPGPSKRGLYCLYTEVSTNI